MKERVEKRKRERRLRRTDDKRKEKMGSRKGNVMSKNERI